MTDSKESGKPLVSLIIPTYNAEATVAASIASARRQTVPDIEMIVVDDGSTDGTAAILRRIADADERVKVVTKTNGGVSSARNAGLAMVRGEWVAFLDADDFIQPTYIQALLSAGASDVDMVIGGATMRQNGKTWKAENRSALVLHDNVIRRLETQVLDPRSGADDACCTDILGCLCSKLFKKSLLHSIRFDERIGMREDAAFILKALSRSRRIAVSRDCGYVYCLDGESASVRFHPGFDAEVDAFLEECRVVWRCDGLPAESFHRGVLRTYMSWLKLYALHPQNNLTHGERRRLIAKSFADPRWGKSFHALSAARLSRPYAMLRHAYLHRDVTAVILLKNANDIRKRLP